MRTLGLADPAFVAATAIAPSGYDTDAAAYITAVETADGQALETAVRDAINAFVVGCKTDGTWPAIEASCILAGARTLAGALVPLVGPAPTNFNFVSGDYNRKTGLKGGGNGSSKNLLTNYTMLASSASNSHAVIFPTESISLNSELFGGTAASGLVAGLNGVYVDTTSASNYYASWTPNNYLGPLARTGALVGVSRSSGASFVARGNGTSQVITQSIASLPSDHILRIFNRNINGVAQYYATGARIAFYSNGESLDLALLDARVTTLINAFAAAIP